MLEAGCPTDYDTCGSWGDASCHEYLNLKGTQPLAPDPAEEAAQHHQSPCDEVAHTAAASRPLVPRGNQKSIGHRT